MIEWKAYIIQSGRFEIVEEFGCANASIYSGLTLLFINFVPVTSSVLSLTLYSRKLAFLFFLKIVPILSKIQQSSFGYTSSTESWMSLLRQAYRPWTDVLSSNFYYSDYLISSLYFLSRSSILLSTSLKAGNPLPFGLDGQPLMQESPLWVQYHRTNGDRMGGGFLRESWLTIGLTHSLPSSFSPSLVSQKGTGSGIGIHSGKCLNPSDSCLIPSPARLPLSSAWVQCLIWCPCYNDSVSTLDFRWYMFLLTTFF